MNKSSSPENMGSIILNNRERNNNIYPYKYNKFKFKKDIVNQKEQSEKEEISKNPY